MAQSGEHLTHCNSIKLRVTGTGNIKTALFDLGEIKFRYLADKAMNENVTGKSITVLANLTSEMIQVEIRTTEIDEVFVLSKLIPYVKPSATGYPQT